MTDRERCPKCGRARTKQILWEFETASVEEIRKCNNCLLEYTNQFVLDEREITNER